MTPFQILNNVKFLTVRSELSQNVNIKVKSGTIDQILVQALDGTDLTYSVNDRQVTLYKKQELQQNQKGISINGTIRDSEREPLPGVNITIKGTTLGTTSDLDGNYFITVPNKNAILVFQYIGFKTQEIEVGSQLNINVEMIENTKDLEEVVVVGFGKQKKVSVWVPLQQ